MHRNFYIKDIGALIFCHTQKYYKEKDELFNPLQNFYSVRGVPVLHTID